MAREPIPTPAAIDNELASLSESTLERIAHDYRPAEHGRLSWEALQPEQRRGMRAANVLAQRQHQARTAATAQQHQAGVEARIVTEADAHRAQLLAEYRAAGGHVADFDAWYTQQRRQAAERGHARLVAEMKDFF